MQAIANERNWTALVQEVALIESPCPASPAPDCDQDMVNWEEVGSIFSDFLADEPDLDQVLFSPVSPLDFNWGNLLQAFTAPVPEETMPMVFTTTSLLPSSRPTPKSTSSKSPSSSKKCPKKCSEPSCWNKVRSRGYCKMHGGGKRCLFIGCDTCSVGGYYCIKHGGGKKCSVSECSNAIQSRGVCKAHGGGARCTVPGCHKSSQGKGLCTSHGGGKRCQVEGCTKGAQSRGRCYAHCG